MTTAKDQIWIERTWFDLFILANVKLHYQVGIDDLHRSEYFKFQSMPSDLARYKWSNPILFTYGNVIDVGNRPNGETYIHKALYHYGFGYVQVDFYDEERKALKEVMKSFPLTKNAVTQLHCLTFHPRESIQRKAKSLINELNSIGDLESIEGVPPNLTNE